MLYPNCPSIRDGQFDVRAFKHQARRLARSARDVASSAARRRADLASIRATMCAGIRLDARNTHACAALFVASMAIPCSINFAQWRFLQTCICILFGGWIKTTAIVAPVYYCVLTIAAKPTAAPSSLFVSQGLRWSVHNNARDPTHAKLRQEWMRTLIALVRPRKISMLQRNGQRNTERSTPTIRMCRLEKKSGLCPPWS